MSTSLRPLSHQTSLSEQAFDTVRKTIASGVIKPGDRITERWLAAQLKVSPTPIREALRRLEQEGLVQRGEDGCLYVYEMTPAEIRELFYLVSVLRAAAARMAATRITNGELARLQNLIDEGKSLINKTSLADVLNNAFEFHNIIIRASHNELLINFLETAQVFYRRYRLRAMELGLESDSKHLIASLREHQALLKALVAHDADKAEQLASAHVRRVGEFVVSSIETTGKDA